MFFFRFLFGFLYIYLYYLCLYLLLEHSAGDEHRHCRNDPLAYIARLLVSYFDAKMYPEFADTCTIVSHEHTFTKYHLHSFLWFISLFFLTFSAFGANALSSRFSLDSFSTFSFKYIYLLFFFTLSFFFALSLYCVILLYFLFYRLWFSIS